MEIVILYSRNPAIGLKVLYCLSYAGKRVEVIAANPASYLKYSRYCKGFHAIGAANSDRHRRRLVERINALSQAYPVAAVLGDDIASHALLHDIAGDITAPAFAPSTGGLLQVCHDKWSFYTHLLRHGLPVPPSAQVENLSSLTEAGTAAVGYPLLVKPLNGESGHGIRRFHDYPTLRQYLMKPGPYTALPLKLQRFIVGSTIGLSLLALNGEILCYDIQRHAEDGARIFEDHPAILEIGRRIVALFGYGGPGHIDFVQESESGRLYALEFNCRYWYSLPVSLWHGGNFPALAVDLAQGRRIPFSPTRPGAYFQPGTVVAMARRPWHLARLDRANWRGFYQAVSDPLPHLASHLRH
ncbi:ATP-grasp domain-containing protein [Pelagibius marinus]|uniref:ATP-grasp domain-containing protein n=1 Tax=Pelagibius marinus TaxID=2762760 RepID=UPI0018724FAE|nr:ATP-grasp domain-containing protein [Pelagibius marinus]